MKLQDMPALPDFQVATLKKQLAMLDNVGAAYKIILPGGEELGTLECAPERQRRKGLYAKGETLAHYGPIILAADVKPGQLVSIPFDRFDPATLASNIGSWALTQWGKGNSTYHRNDKAGAVELMRLG